MTNFKLRFLPSLIAAILLMGCKEKTSTASEKTVPKEVLTKLIDYPYVTNFSCDTCKENKYTMLTFNKNGTYELFHQTLYCDKPVDTLRGEIHWIEEKEILDLGTNFYKMYADSLLEVDKEGNNVFLSKNVKHVLKPAIEYEPDTDDIHITYRKYADPNGNMFNATFNTKDEPHTVSLEFKNEKIKFNQTSAWSKGAEYEAKNIPATFSFQREKAIWSYYL